MAVNGATVNHHNDIGEQLQKKHVSPSHPMTSLIEISRDENIEILSRDFATLMDSRTESLRHEFHYPKMEYLPGVDLELVNADDDCIYLCGNSMGLVPKVTKSKIDRELDKWAKLGVHGHLNGEMPWAHCDECVDTDMATLVGALREEIAVMNGLTVNLHLQLITFYRPTPTRHKILLEEHAFPSDHYAIESVIGVKGYKPEECMICLKPRPGEETLRSEDIMQTIAEEGDSIALVLLSGVQYYTGQVFDIPAITEAAQAQGCTVGWDLAHAAGNVELQLHDWNVDFACWCTYKYMNSGAGCIAGFFIHQKNFELAKSYPRLQGWWSHKMSTRFQMTNVMELEEGARGFRISNPPPLLCASVEASLEVFNKTSMAELRARSKLLTAYLEHLLMMHFPNPEQSHYSAGKASARIITPSHPDERGAQLSVMFSIPINKVFKQLQKRGVACDKREPNVLRLAPAPLYNTFTDIYRFILTLEDAISSANQL